MPKFTEKADLTVKWPPDPAIDKTVVNRAHKQVKETLPGHEACVFPENDNLYRRYHDEEWGVPVYDDQAFFEKICLEGFQSGLSWKTILHKREALRQSFDYFDPHKIAQYNDAKIQKLLDDKRIIRNRRKILSVINNANRYLEMQGTEDSLATLCWQFQPAMRSRPKYMTLDWLSSHPHTDESRRLSTLLKKSGWTFVGPTTMYALMQALGIVNDHVYHCPRRKVLDDLQANRQPA